MIKVLRKEYMNRFFKQIFLVIWREITKSTPKEKRKTYQFVLTRNTRQKMVEHRVSEKQIQEVFYKGTMFKENMMSRDYNGYRIGIYFKKDFDRKEIVIISCWRNK